MEQPGIEGDGTFAFGREQWDLIVLSYVSLRHLGRSVYDALKPGGLVIVEGFHRDATKNASIGDGVVFDTNELLQLFARYRIVHHEDAVAVGDFGQKQTRVVRLAARKP
jgi:SAM-dependent methyltransferase